MSKSEKGLRRAQRKAEHALRQKQLEWGVRQQHLLGPKEPPWWWKEVLKVPIGQRVYVLNRLIKRFERYYDLDEGDEEELRQMYSALKTLGGRELIVARLPTFKYILTARHTESSLLTRGFDVYYGGRLIGWITKYDNIWYAYSPSRIHGFRAETRHGAAKALLKVIN